MACDGLVSTHKLLHSHCTLSEVFELQAVLALKRALAIFPFAFYDSNYTGMECGVVGRAFSLRDRGLDTRSGLGRTRHEEFRSASVPV